MLLSAEKDLDLITVVQNLDLVLRALPEEVLNEQSFGSPNDQPGSGLTCTAVESTSVSPPQGPQSNESSETPLNTVAVRGPADDDESESVSDAVSEACDVLCCSHMILLFLALTLWFCDA